MRAGGAGQAAARAAGARVRAARIGAHRQGRRARDRGDQPRPARRWSPRAQFQEDLYYRLNVIPIAHAAAARAARRHPAARRALRRAHAAARRQAHRRHRRPRRWRALVERADWPGNVRELENTVERAVVLSPRPMIRRATSTLRRRAGARRPGCPPARPANRIWTGPSAKPSAARSKRRAASRKTRRKRWASASARSATTSPSTASTRRSGAAKLTLETKVQKPGRDGARPCSWASPPAAR